MNDSHFHYLNPKLEEPARSKPDNHVEDLGPRSECEHCIATGQGQRRQRAVIEDAAMRALREENANLKRQLAAAGIRQGAEIAGTGPDPDEAAFRAREAAEDAERARKKAEREAKAAAR